MSHGDRVPAGWECTFDGDEIVEYGYESDNLEVTIQPDATPDHARHRTASDQQYRVRLKRTDTGLGGNIDWDLALGEDVSEFDIQRVTSMATARETAREFMRRFNENREAVEQRKADDGAVGEFGAVVTTPEADDRSTLPGRGTDESHDDDPTEDTPQPVVHVDPDAVFDERAAAAAVAMDAAAAVQTVAEMGGEAADEAGSAEPTPETPSTFDTEAGGEATDGDGGEPAEADADATDGERGDDPDGPVVAALAESVGEALRAVIHYDHGSYDAVHFRDDIEDDETDFERLHGELRFLSPEVLEDEMDDAGAFQHVAVGFEESLVVRFVRGEGEETLVSVDRDHPVEFPAFADTVRAALEQ
jgi:hypothetical protein